MGHNRRLKPRCSICADTYSAKRANAGYHICMPCGEKAARAVKHASLPLSKSNYYYVSSNNLDFIKQTNPKRTT